MKRHKLLWAVVVAGIAAVVVGATIGPTVSRALTRMASDAGATLAALRLWLHAVATHVTTAHLIEAAAAAWLVFVLSLVLLARSRSNQPQVPRAEVSNTTSTATVIGEHQRPQAPDALHQEMLPPSPMRPVPHSETVNGPVTAQDSTRDMATSRAALTAAAEPRVEMGARATPNVWKAERQTLGHSRSRAVALTGASLVRGRLLRYGVFLVVEDIGIAPTAGDASQRVAEALIEQMMPLLMSDRAMESAQFSGLLKLAVIQADVCLRRQSICNDTDLSAAIAGVMVIGNVAHVVTVNTCRAYVFRREDGLILITRNHTAMADRVGNALHEPATFDAHRKREQVSVKMDHEQAADDIEVRELAMHPGDLLLLGSPGLPRALSAPQIETHLRAATDPRIAASLLVREGTPFAERQDFSVIVVKPHSGKSDWMTEFGIATTDSQTP